MVCYNLTSQVCFVIAIARSLFVNLWLHNPDWKYLYNDESEIILVSDGKYAAQKELIKRI